MDRSRVRQGRVRTRREVVDRFWEQVPLCSSVREAATRAGMSFATGRRVFAQGGGVRPCLRESSGRYLSFAERELIAVWRAQGAGVREIARRLGRAPSTISRELVRNGRSHARGPGRVSTPPYLASVAQDRAERAARRPKERKLLTIPRLARAVGKKLKKRWSPEQISAWLACRHAHDRNMQVSHETIYRALYVQGRGGLKRELVAALRTGRAVRKPRRVGDGQGQRRAKVPAELLISARPAEADDRAVPGHWEGDLIVGKGSGSAIGTLVERTTRFTMLLHLPGAHDAVAVRDAMAGAIATLPRQLWRSLTWDQGAEMVGAHLQIRLQDGLPIYFCDPHSPWQRGTNENTNGLLRQYFPKGTNLAVHSAKHLQAIARELNERPRKTLGWDTPAQALAKLLSTPRTTGVATTP